MPGRVGGVHPALKHGAYTATSVLPGESRAAFEKLYRNLITEYSPSGVSEDDIIATMARLIWRKQNLGTHFIAARARAHRDSILEFDLKGHVDAMYRRDDLDPVKAAEALQARHERVDRELGDAVELLDAGEVTTFIGLEKELAVIERLDSALVRCLKQLALVRGVKSLSEAPSLVSPKHIAGPPKAA